MIHRRTLYDDALGVGEPLNETAYDQGLVVRGRHILLVDTPRTSAVNHRVQSQELFMQPLSSFSLPLISYQNYSMFYHQTWSALIDDYPLNIHLLTFDQLADKQYLIRLEHYFELTDDDKYSQDVIVDLQDLFRTLGSINDIVELNLSANLPLNEMNRLQWYTNDNRTVQTNIQRMLSNQ
jgi:hypothetical protein